MDKNYFYYKKKITEYIFQLVFFIYIYCIFCIANMRKNSMKRSSTNIPKNLNRFNFKDTFERNFITYGNAMKEFLLKPSQLEGLKKVNRRSPYEQEMSMWVYSRKEVEKRAIEIWGSLENLEREKRNLLNLKKIEEQIKYEGKKNLRESRREKQGPATKGRTREAIIISIAIAIDVLNVIFKLLIWILTQSDSILGETIHSAADTFNQCILAFGICQTHQAATSRHPYGYSNMMYVVSLISGVGIFCLGAAISTFIGIYTLTRQNHEIIYTEIAWAFIVLLFSTVTEGICFCCSTVATYKEAKAYKLNFFYFTFRSVCPGLTVILMEDFGAVIGNIIAAAMLTTSWKMGNYIPDAVGCILIGMLLATVALFLIITNSAALVGRSIRSEILEEINKVIESDIMVRAIYDVKGIDIGNNLVRYKAELDFDGAELTRYYLDNMDLNQLLAQVKEIKNIDELEFFMVTHGENIIDLVGGEIDRIEYKVRKIFPEVRHMDLEIV